jgi:hypothetical protein
MKRFLILAVVAGLAGASTAGAALLAYEPFNYNPTNLFGGGVNGGTGFGGGWQAGFGSQGYLNEVRSGGSIVGASSLTSLGNHATLSAQEGLELFPGSGNINYLARSLNLGAFPTQSNGTNIGAVGTTLWGSFTYSGSNDASVNPLQLTLNTTSAHVLNYSLPNGGAGSLAVFAITFGVGATDTASFYINPSAFDPLSTVPTAVLVGNFKFSGIEFDMKTRSGVAFNGSDIDEIRFGDNASDVAVVVPVPEPTSSVLLGGLAAFALRRRRSV